MQAEINARSVYQLPVIGSILSTVVQTVCAHMCVNVRYNTEWGGKWPCRGLKGAQDNCI